MPRSTNTPRDMTSATSTRAHDLLVGAAALLICGITAWSQELPSAPLPEAKAQPVRRTSGLFSPYRVPHVFTSAPGNSKLVDRLLHDGKISLTLQDAIELAIENNFDVELQRYGRAFAEAELLRSKAGGQLRGIPTTINELPAGEGGPGEPLLTTVSGYSPVLQLPSSAADLATITGTQSNLSVLGPTPYSAGTPVPIFDPLITTDISLSQQNYPQATSFSTGSNYFSSHAVGGSVSYSQAFSTGTQFSTVFMENRINEASTRLNLNPFITGYLNVSMTQPLLKGFGIHVNRRFISIAKSEGKIADAVFEQQLISTISDATRLYWDLVSLQQDLEVKRQSLEAAERLYKDTKNEVDLGTQAPVDLTSSMAQVASNRQAYINSQGLVLQQELLLKEVLTREGVSDPRLASTPIQAVTPIDATAAEDGETLASLIDEAMKRRPDIALAEEQQETSRQSLKGSQNALLPELNLLASMQNNGGAGTLNPTLSSTGGLASTPPSNLLGGAGTAFSQIFGRNYPDYAVGVQLNIPIRNRLAKADVIRDQLQYSQSQVQINKLHSQVRLQVGNAWIAAQQARESYEAAIEARKLQEQAIEVERAKFEAGVATAYEYLQYQSALAEARSAAVTALGVYAKARTALQRAVGSTLNDNNIVLENAYSNQSRRD